MSFWAEALVISLAFALTVPVLATDLMVSGNGAVFHENVSTASNISLAMPSNPAAVFIQAAAKSDGSLVYASYWDTNGGGIAIFDPKANAYLGNLPSACPYPRKLVLDTASRLYAPCSTGIEVFSIASNAKLYDIAFPAGIGEGEHAAIKNDGTLIVATNSGAVLSYASGAVTPSYQSLLNSPVRYVLLSSDGTKLFVTVNGEYNYADSGGTVRGGNVVVLNSSLAVTDAFQTGSGVIEFMAMGGGRVYAPSADGYLSAIDPNTDVVLDSKFLEPGLTGVALSAADNKLFVAASYSSKILTVTVGGTPANDVIGDSYFLPANSNPFGLAILPVSATDPVQQLVKQLTTAINAMRVSPQLKSALLRYVNSLPTRITALTLQQRTRLVSQTRTFISLVQTLSRQRLISSTQAAQLINLASALIAALG